MKRWISILILLLVSFVAHAQVLAAAQAQIGDVRSGLVADWDFYKPAEYSVNQLKNSQDFSAWSTAFATAAFTSAVSDPQGENWATKLTEGSGTVTPQAYSPASTGSGTWTGSVYMRAAQRSFGWLRFNTGAHGTPYAWFNLSTCSAGTVQSPLTATATTTVGAWCRVSITISGDNVAYLVLGVSSADAQTSYTGDGTSGIYIWGAQLQSGSVTGYVPTDAVQDQSGNHHTLNLIGNPAFSPYLSLASGKYGRGDFSVSSPFTIVALFNASNAGTEQDVVAGQSGAGSPQLYISGANTCGFASSGVAGIIDGNACTGTPAFVAVRYHQASGGSMWQAGIRGALGVWTGAFGAGPIQVGGNAGTNAPLQGTLYRVRIYNRQLSDYELAHLNQYFAARYAHYSTPVTFPVPAAPALLTDLSARSLAFYPRLQRQFVALQFGAAFHFNMSTFTNQQWADPNLDPSTFAPTNLTVAAIDQWMQTAVDGGARYVMLTAKHHDGFALWPTACHATGQAAYSVAQSSWYAGGGFDIVSAFVAEARKYHLYPSLYFSVTDRTYELRSGTTAATGTAGYLAYTECQLSELLSNYGPIISVWTDGWGWTTQAGCATVPGGSPATTGGVCGYSHIPYATIDGYVKGLQPSTLLIENSHNVQNQASDIAEWEVPFTGSPDAGNTLPSESIDSISTNDWFWNPGIALNTAAYVNTTLATSISRHSTYLLNLAADQSGWLPSDQVAIFRAIVH